MNKRFRYFHHPNDQAFYEQHTRAWCYVLLRLTAIAAVICIGIVFAMIMLGPLGEWRHRPKLRRPLHFLMRLWFRILLFFLDVRVQCHALSTLPPRAFVVANHISWLDIIVLGGFYNLRFVAKAEVSKWPMIGLLAKLSGTRFIERGHPSHYLKVLDAIARDLRHGQSVCIFPEGTSGIGEQVSPFRHRMFSAAVAEEVPIIGLTLSYPTLAQIVNPAVPFIKDHNFFKRLIDLLRCRKINAEIQFATLVIPGKNSVCRDLAKQIQQAVQTNIDQQKKKYADQVEAQCGKES